MSTLLEVEALRVRINGRQLLDVGRLDIGAGALAVITGNAGSGKSLLAAALCGDVPASGQVRLDGHPVSGRPSRRARAGLTAAVRDGQRLSGCTVREALNLAARGARSRGADALDLIPQLRGRADLPAQLLSGGEQQLLQVACAWCASPRVLVLDSPTVGLAADASATVVWLARDVAGRGGCVVWLEQDRRAAPGAPGWTLVRGRLALPAGGSSVPGAPAGEADPAPGRIPGG